MSTSAPRINLSRRTAMAGLGVGGLGLALSVPKRSAAAQEAPADLASHPLAGTWAAMTPSVVPQTHGADGSIIAAFPPNYLDPALGLTFQGPALGRWEADGERTGHFTIIQALSDAGGAYIGTFQLEAGIEASEDGQSWIGNTPPRIIVRDAANAIVSDDVFPIEPAVYGIRIGATSDSFELPVVAPGDATPTS